MKDQTATDQAVPQFYIHADSSCGHFRDAKGRVLLLRGVNFASSAKTPVGQPSDKLEGYYEAGKSGDLSFVNRVLDLDDTDCDLHLARLREWGFNCLRYIFTWEALEHEGPGKYDQQFIEYTCKVLQKCKDYGFRVFMDPHQDLFSRFAGGCGAPYWTIIAAGMNPERFSATCAAVIHCEWPSKQNPQPDTFPDMIWASNWTRLACQTLFTLFFAGRTFAPLCQIDGINIQDWLQKHYLNAVQELAKGIAEYQNGSLLDECVIGWDSLNEPSSGLLGIEDLGVHGKEQVLQVGPMPTAFQAMLLGAGFKTEVENWKFSSTGPKRDGSVTIDPAGQLAWLLPEEDEVDQQGRNKRWGWKRADSWKLGQCVWALHGVWNPSMRTLLKPDYFQSLPGKTQTIDFGLDFWRSHWSAYAKMIRQHHPDAILFVHTPILKLPPDLKADYSEVINERACFSPHFYDGVTLVTKHWNWFNYDALGFLRGKYRYQWQAVRVGEKAIRQCLHDQLAMLKDDAQDCIGNYPTMMGEIGVAFDLDKGEAYKTGDYKNQIHALDASMAACDGTNILNKTIWTYCPDNTHKGGDQWNREDLSLWSKDDEARNRSVYRSDNTTGRKSMESLQSSMASSRTLLAPELYIGKNQSTTFHELNDGARALPAFCRPYPRLTVGVPKSISFNVQTSEFRLEISIITGHQVKEENLATEIYVPFVHYASSPEDISAQAAAQMMSYSDVSNSNSTLLSDSPPLEQQGLDLALDVKVSSGKWNVTGQTLYWYHDGFARLGNCGGDEVVETVTIKRTGGAIPMYAGDTPSGPRSWLENIVSACVSHCTVS